VPGLAEATVMKALCAAVMVLMSSSTTAGALQLIDEPQGLAWSNPEVAAAGANAARPILEQAERSGRRGCRRHCELIQKVWVRLTAVCRDQQANRPYAPTLSLRVVQSDDMDAFAVPDGTLVLSEAFIRDLQLDEAQLAFVLAHEIAHVLLEHERETLTAALSMLPRSVPRSVDDVYVELDHNLALFKSLEMSMHQAEYEADHVGMQIAALAGYSPSEQLRFMENEAAREHDGAAVVSTHPTANNRLSRLRTELPLADRVHRHGLELRERSILELSDPHQTAAH
jgi:predicted Zn-dependent protease